MGWLSCGGRSVASLRKRAQHRRSRRAAGSRPPRQQPRLRRLAPEHKTVAGALGGLVVAAAGPRARKRVASGHAPSAIRVAVQASLIDPSHRVAAALVAASSYPRSGADEIAITRVGHTRLNAKHMSPMLSCEVWGSIDPMTTRRVREDARHRSASLPLQDRRDLAPAPRLPHQPDRDAHLCGHRRPRLHARPQGPRDARAPAARNAILGDECVPASTLVIIDGLASSDMLVEIEAWAARSPG